MCEFVEEGEKFFGEELEVIGTERLYYDVFGRFWY